eukprot:XP_025013376.1 uncharacterized protein LOC107261380 [Ricinus communis]
MEKTVKRIRKETKERCKNSKSSSPSTPLELETNFDLVDSSSDSELEETMENLGRTLRELAAPNVDQQPLCIQYPDLEVAFKLKSGLIHLLPTLHGLENEDPHKHLKEFHVVCSSMRPQGLSEEKIKMHAFPFSLADRVNDWLFYLPSGSITTSTDMARAFLDKFFPASRAASIRREICGIKQKDVETLHEYWERFKKLCASCPQHGITEQLLIQYFYEGLLPMERKVMDATSGGAIVNKTPQATRDLISIMATNSQQFGFGQDSTSRRVNEVSSNSIETQLSKLTSLVQKLALGNAPKARVCGSCTDPSHPTNMCPTLQEESNEQVNMVGGFPNRKYDPYSNTYNPGYKDHPNLSYGSRNQNFQNSNQNFQNSHHNFQQRSGNFQQSPLVKQGNESKYSNLEAQVGQLASSLSKLESQGKLPSQTIVNPRHNASVITLRSGKELKEFDDAKRHGQALEEGVEKEMATSS